MSTEPMSEEYLTLIESVWADQANDMDIRCGRFPRDPRYPDTEAMFNPVVDLVAEVRRLRAPTWELVEVSYEYEREAQRLAVAEAEVADLRPKAAALDALQQWADVPEQGVDCYDGEATAWKQREGEVGYPAVIVKTDDLLALGAALAAQAATPEGEGDDGD